MAKKKLKIPTPDNAFADGCLNLGVAQSLVKHHNQILKVKLNGAPDGRVLETEDEQMIDLSPMFGRLETVYLIKNGELAKAMIPIFWIP